MLELTTEHPLAWTAPWWATVHGIDRPVGPTLEDRLAVCGELGVDVRAEVGRREPTVWGDRQRRVDHLVDHLCLREDEVPELLAADAQLGPPPPREVATVWWDA